MSSPSIYFLQLFWVLAPYTWASSPAMVTNFNTTGTTVSMQTQMQRQILLQLPSTSSLDADISAIDWCLFYNFDDTDISDHLFCASTTTATTCFTTSETQPSEPTQYTFDISLCSQSSSSANIAIVGSYSADTTLICRLDDTICCSLSADDDDDDRKCMTNTRDDRTHSRIMNLPFTYLDNDDADEINGDNEIHGFIQLHDDDHDDLSISCVAENADMFCRSVESQITDTASLQLLDAIWMNDTSMLVALTDETRSMLMLKQCLIFPSDSDNDGNCETLSSLSMNGDGDVVPAEFHIVAFDSCNVLLSAPHIIYDFCSDVFYAYPIADDDVSDSLQLYQALYRERGQTCFMVSDDRDEDKDVDDKLLIAMNCVSFHVDILSTTATAENVTRTPSDIQRQNVPTQYVYNSDREPVSLQLVETTHMIGPFSDASFITLVVVGGMVIISCLLCALVCFHKYQHRQWYSPEGAGPKSRDSIGQYRSIRTGTGTGTKSDHSLSSFSTRANLVGCPGSRNTQKIIECEESETMTVTSVPTTTCNAAIERELPGIDEDGSDDDGDGDGDGDRSGNFRFAHRINSASHTTYSRMASNKQSSVSLSREPGAVTPLAVGPVAVVDGDDADVSENEVLPTLSKGTALMLCPSESQIGAEGRRNSIHSYKKRPLQIKRKLGNLHRSSDRDDAHSDNSEHTVTPVLSSDKETPFEIVVSDAKNAAQLSPLSDGCDADSQTDKNNKQRRRRRSNITSLHQFRRKSGLSASYGTKASTVHEPSTTADDDDDGESLSQRSQSLSSPSSGSPGRPDCGARPEQLQQDRELSETSETIEFDNERLRTMQCESQVNNLVRPSHSKSPSKSQTQSVLTRCSFTEDDDEKKYIMSPRSNGTSSLPSLGTLTQMVQDKQSRPSYPSISRRRHPRELDGNEQERTRWKHGNVYQPMHTADDEEESVEYEYTLDDDELERETVCYDGDVVTL